MSDEPPFQVGARVRYMDSPFNGDYRAWIGRQGTVLEVYRSASSGEWMVKIDHDHDKGRRYGGRYAKRFEPTGGPW